MKLCLFCRKYIMEVVLKMCVMVCIDENCYCCCVVYDCGWRCSYLICIFLVYWLGLDLVVFFILGVGVNRWNSFLSSYIVCVSCVSLNRKMLLRWLVFFVKCICVWNLVVLIFVCWCWWLWLVCWDWRLFWCCEKLLLRLNVWLLIIWFN